MLGLHRFHIQAIFYVPEETSELRVQRMRDPHPNRRANSTFFWDNRFVFVKSLLCLITCADTARVFHSQLWISCMTRSPHECHPQPDLKAGDEVSFVNADQVTQDETHRIQNGARSAFPPVMRAPIARSKWENPWNPISSAGRLAESKR